MDNLRAIIHYQEAEYGSVKLKLAEVLDSRGISRNKLHKLTGIKYDVITRYYKSDQVELIDLNFLAKVCYVLDCEISDLLEYQCPET